MMAAAAVAHDTSPGACKVEKWRLVSIIGGWATIEDVTTCAEGEMQRRLYEGAGDGRPFVGASIALIEGNAFQAMFLDVEESDNPTIDYAITD